MYRSIDAKIAQKIAKYVMAENVEELKILFFSFMEM